MNSKIKTVYKIELVLLLLNILLFFIPETSQKYLFGIIGLGIIFYISTILFKTKRDTNLFRKTALRIVIITLIFYFILIFLMGLILGYNKTLFSLKPSIWLNGLIPMLVITILTELLRYNLIKNNITDKKAIYGITILLAMFYIILNVNLSNIKTWYDVFKLICVTAMPTIAHEMLSSYMVYNYGFLPTIFYKLVMNLYLFILPIITNLGDYLYSVINLLIPFTIYLILNKYIKTNEEQREKIQKLTGLNTSFIAIPVIIALLIIIALVSGIFKYQLLAIASDSMNPIYYRGDAIIFEKIDKNLIEVGDILVFEKNGTIIAHRVIEIKEDTEKKYFYTKGDANNSPDNTVTYEEEVKGIAKRVVKYIGYPTVWINELLGGEIRENE